MSDHGFSLFRSYFSGITQIDLMMQPLIGDVQGISLAFHKLMHHGDRSRFIIIGPDVHALDTQALVIGQKFHFGEINLFPGGSFPYSPVKIILRHKIRQADDRDPFEIVFAGKIYTDNIILPPEAFQRGNYIVKISFDLMAAFLLILMVNAMP